MIRPGLRLGQRTSKAKRGSGCNQSSAGGDGRKKAQKAQNRYALRGLGVLRLLRLFAAIAWRF
jgi:hypothetical protein